jgi:hypothetical protein
MKTKAILLAVGLGVLVAKPLLAQEQIPDANLVDQMEQKLAESDSQAKSLKGGPQAVWLLRQAEIENSIDRLNAGQPVDPKEVDRILEGQVNY